MTKDQVEIDLIIERRGLPRTIIEIKSSEQISRDDIQGLNRFSRDFKNCEVYCLSREPHPKIIEGVNVLPWQQSLEERDYSNSRKESAKSLICRRRNNQITIAI